VLTFKWVTWACVGDLAAVFREVEATHLLAVEDTGDTGANVVRGTFSRSRLERECESSVIKTEVSSEECQR
jgi:hypothetical protein